MRSSTLDPVADVLEIPSALGCGASHFAGRSGLLKCIGGQPSPQILADGSRPDGFGVQLLAVDSWSSEY